MNYSLIFILVLISIFICAAPTAIIGLGLVSLADFLYSNFIVIFISICLVILMMSLRDEEVLFRGFSVFSVIFLCILTFWHRNTHEISYFRLFSYLILISPPTISELSAFSHQLPTSASPYVSPHYGYPFFVILLYYEKFSIKLLYTYL